MARLAARSGPSTTMEEKARSAGLPLPVLERADLLALFIAMAECRQRSGLWQGGGAMCAGLETALDRGHPGRTADKSWSLLCMDDSYTARHFGITLSGPIGEGARDSEGAGYRRLFRREVLQLVSFDCSPP